MRITPLRSEGLAHLSYFISFESEAMVADPRSDVDVYLKLDIISVALDGIRGWKKRGSPIKSREQETRGNRAQQRGE